MRADYEPTAEMEVKHLAEQCETLLRENEQLRAALVGINIAVVRDSDLDSAAKIVIDIRRELQF